MRKLTSLIYEKLWYIKRGYSHKIIAYNHVKTYESIVFMLILENHPHKSNVAKIVDD